MQRQNIQPGDGVLRKHKLLGSESSGKFVGVNDQHYKKLDAMCPGASHLPLSPTP